MRKTRRNGYDVTNRIDVTNPEMVSDEICEIFRKCCPRASTRPVRQALVDLARLYRGEYPGYHACDTFYHDLQHSLDMTLAMARLIAGHDRHAARSEKLGAERMAAGLITAMYHDAGYIRSRHDHKHACGAEYTIGHVRRSARFLRRYLPRLGLKPSSSLAGRIVHYTGYEISIDRIRVAKAKDKLVGYMLGTADLIAQMADRCYLEKCRDRLYPEFVLGGIAHCLKPDGREQIVYASGEDLLRKTHAFYENVVRKRLDETFEQTHRYARIYFEGEDLYNQAITNNLDTLKKAIAADNLAMLNRRPPHNPACANIPALLKAWSERHRLQVERAAPTPIN